jgi:hypothetical protein
MLCHPYIINVIIMSDWDKDFLKSKWKRKKCQLVNPKNNELLADITLSPSDFTRRSFEFKINKWHAQYPEDTAVAEYWLDRGSVGGIAGKIVRGDARYIKCDKPTCKKGKCR